MKYCDFSCLDRDKIGSMSQICGLNHYEFADGKGKGVEAVEVRTGSGLEFTVLPGRGMDIAWTSYKGLPVSYMSKTGVVSPAYYESDGMNWLHNFFAGTLTTCGLLNVGGPEVVNHPVIGDRVYGLHGRISNTAAEQVSLYEEWENGEYVMKVSGLMREAILHGEELTMRREISTKLASKEFTITDTITNRAATPQDIMLLYHFNMGYPLLDANSRFIADSNEVIPMSDDAAKEIDDAFKCSEPILGMGERCYAHMLNSDADGNVKVAFVNDELEVGVALEYNKNALPYLNQWKMLNKREYVMGIEPCTAMPQGYAKAKENGSIVTVAPGEKYEISITYKLLDGKDEISAYEKEIL